MEAIENDLRHLDELAEFIRQQREKRLKDKIALLRSLYREVYYIKAVPSDTFHNVHDVAHFSNVEEARAIFVPASYDVEECVTWKYSIGTVLISELSDDQVLEIDQGNSLYPYTGADI